MSLLKKIGLLFILIACTQQAFAQPVWSPEVRSRREMSWLQAVVHITDSQANCLRDISLKYQQEMDKAAQKKNKDPLQSRLMHHKDVFYKKVLDSGQYRLYIQRETQIRNQAKIIYKGHQPL